MNRKKFSSVVHKLPIISAHRLCLQVGHKLVLGCAGTNTGFESSWAYRLELELNECQTHLYKPGAGDDDGLDDCGGVMRDMYIDSRCGSREAILIPYHAF